MTICFDDEVTEGESPQELSLCARVIVPILETKPNSSWPIEQESQKLYDMEDELVDQLQSAQVFCRLVGRLTYDGLREIVFQVGDEDAFRPIVGRWMNHHKDYEIDVSEHEGWEFFDEYIRPSDEDRFFMAEDRVIENLLKSGSDPSLEHELDYCFDGDAGPLKAVAQRLLSEGYQHHDELDFDCGRIELFKRFVLDRQLIREESWKNRQMAEQLGADLNGWGAASVSGET